MDLCTRKKKEKKKLEGWKSAFIAFSDKALVCETCSLCKVSLHRASIFRKKQSFGCHDAVTIFLLCRRKAELYKRATDLGFQQLSNQSAKNQSGSNVLGAYSKLWKGTQSTYEHKTNSFVCECVVSVCHVWLWQAKQRFPQRQAWTGKQVLPEQLRMRTWGVSTNLIKEAASAASQPPNVIYVTVSHNFMTACKHRAEGKQLSLLEPPSRSTHHKKGQ